jgi:hypothetical protein
MEMVAVVLFGVVALVVIERQKNAMEQLSRVRAEKRNDVPASSRQRR